MLVLGKEQSRGRMWRFTGDVVVKLLTAAAQVFDPRRARTLALWVRGVTSLDGCWGRASMRCAQPGLAGLDLASGLARARKSLQGQLCPTPYALPSSRSLLGSFVLLLFFCL